METRTFLTRGQRLGYWDEGKCQAALSLCDRALDITRKLLAAKLRQIEAAGKANGQ